MKFKFRTLSAALLALCTFAAAPPASAQVTATTIVQLTNIPPNLQAESISNSIASVIPLTRDSGLGFEWSFVSKATSYSNEVTQFVFANVTPVAGRGNWSNPDIDPIDQIDEQLDALSAVVGTTENINVVMSVGEWRTLRTNDKVKKRLGITGGLTLKREQLVDGLLFPVNLEVSGVLSSTTKFGQSTVTKSRAMAGYCLITHSKPSPTTDDASAFKCFSTSSVLVDSVREYREESANSSIYAVDWSQQLKVTGSACIKALAIT